MGRRNKIVRLMSCVIAGTLLFGIAGCKLAKEDTADGEMQNTNNGDKLCGAYVMYQDGILAGQALDQEKNKVYAVKNGTDYEFKGVGGSYIINYEKKDSVDGSSYRSTVIAGGIDDTATEHHVGDTGNDDVIKTNLSGRIKVVHNPEIRNIAVCPIYMDENDQMYIQLEGKEYVECPAEVGSSVTSTLSGSYTKKEDGTTKNYEMKAAISVETVDQLEFVVVKQMNKNDQVLNSTKYEKKDFKGSINEEGAMEYDSKKLKLSKDASYLMIERHVITKDDTKEIKREAVTIDKTNKENNPLGCDFAEKNGIVSAREIELIG